MASTTLTIPDAQLSRVLTAFAAYRGVDLSTMNAAQKAAFFKSAMMSHIIETVQAYELPGVQAAAVASAVATRKADIDANITIT